MGQRREFNQEPKSPPRPRLGRAALIARLNELALPVVEAAGLDLIELRMHGAPRGNRKLQLFIDRMPGQGAVTIEDCASTSRKLGAVLELEEQTLGEFELEVSSPGMSRLLRGTDDMRRFAGVRARVSLEDEDEARRETVIGLLAECDEQTLHVALDSGATRAIDRRAITRAVLDPTLEQWMEMGRKQAAEVKHDADQEAVENREPAEEGTMAQGEVR